MENINQYIDQIIIQHKFNNQKNYQLIIKLIKKFLKNKKT